MPMDFETLDHTQWPGLWQDQCWVGSWGPWARVWLYLSLECSVPHAEITSICKSRFPLSAKSGVEYDPGARFHFGD